MIRSIILFAFILLGMASCVVGEDEYASASDFGNVVEIGDSLPRFSVTLSNGSTLSNESLKGRVAVLTFSIPPVVIAGESCRSYKRLTVCMPTE